LAGDRSFSEDEAIVGGLGRFQGDPVVIIGQEKGADTKSRLRHNFGMARPEGYRKAVRLMQLAERFGLPVLTFVDTAGAYPGIGAEERGQAEAIARSTDCCLGLGSPIIATIIGEGGSGGAVAIATANSVVMLEHSIYSVISPEGAASILWHDPARASEAATAMRITADHLKSLGVIDLVVSEPVGGAHRHREQAIADTGKAISAALLPLRHLTADEIRLQRRQKFLQIGRSLGL
jgi:acetyl-CoA carboxylase carboxyl transferase subunit alpha